MTKTKIEIKSIIGSVIFEHEQEGNSVKETVIAFLLKNAGKIINNVDLSNLDLSGIDFSNSTFDNSTFDNSTFDNSTFDNSTFDNSKFDNSTFDNSTFDNSTFDNSKFYNSKFDNSTFYNSTFDNSTFDNSTFDNSTFYNSTFYNSTFYNSTFDNSTFDNSTFDNSTFDNSTFYNSTFDNNSIESLKNSGALEPVRCDFFGRLLILKNEVPALKLALIEGRINGSAYEGECCCFIGTIANAKKCYYKDLLNIKPDPSSDTERWFLGINKGDTPENSPIVKQTIEWIEEFENLLND